MDAQKAQLIEDTLNATYPHRLAFTPHETAKILGIHYNSVLNLLDRNILKASKALRTKMIPKTEIVRMLADTL